ncbi:hypothetical protein C8R43DRAFT_208100 [Mycena crocata]|nr:hypothetical protein C8R43DRAFT_208100 [Mycena crocata]
MDIEKAAGSPHTSEVDPSDEAAAAKIWAVYVSEAEKYDKALVESWKRDMEGMLIFAGLFSASLTAFLMESYKTLRADSGDLTVQLLSRIAQNLMESANGIPFNLSQPATFTPSTSALVCNGLWFISLGLSLSCALIATLLEQWARDFIHRSEIRSAPVIRARTFSYLFYGLKRFNMHAIVEAVPLLLHISLLFFFAGLVAFLVPINTTMVIITSFILGTVTAVYSVLTLLPLWYLDCPYRTPVSGAFWRITKQIELRWNRRRRDTLTPAHSPVQPETMVEAVSRSAMEPTASRTRRDGRALMWTVKSLSDEAELEPFIEAIPDTLWGPDDRRSAYSFHFRNLVQDPDVKLYSRIHGLLESCNSGLLSADAMKRRQITCYKSLWAIASLFDPSTNATPFDFSDSLDFSHSDVDILHYSTSTRVLMRWSTFWAVHIPLTDLEQRLLKWDDPTRTNRDSDLTAAVVYLKHLRQNWDFWDIIGSDWSIRSYLDDAQGNPAAHLVPHFISIIRDIRTQTPYRIRFQFLRAVAGLTSPPYRWRETLEIIAQFPSTEFYVLRRDLEYSLDEVVTGLLSGSTTGDLNWTEDILIDLFSSWCPTDPSTPLPLCLIQLLNAHRSDEALLRMFTESGVTSYIWAAFPQTLISGPSEGPYGGGETTRDEILTALWRLTSLTSLASLDGSICTPLLQATSNNFPGHVSPSVNAMLKQMCFRILRTSAPEDYTVPFIEEILPPIPVDDFSDGVSSISVGQYTHHRICEAQILLFAEFLERRVTEPLLYMPLKTLQHIAGVAPQARIPNARQTRLAHAIDAVFKNWSSAGLAGVVIDNPIFDLYAGVSFPSYPRIIQDPRTAWLDDSAARGRIREALISYLDGVPPSSPHLPRVHAIINGLNSLHQ